MNVYETKIITDNEQKQLSKREKDYPYILEDNSLSIIEYYNKHFHKIWLSHKIEILKILKDEDSNDKYIELKAFTNFGEEVFIISMSKLNKKEFPTLQQKWTFNEKHIDLIIEYILIKCQHITTHILYKTVGWFEYNNELLFRTNRIITDDKKIFNLYQYRGNFQLQGKIYDDNFELYLKDLNRLLTTGGTMFAVVVGLSSALVSLLKHFIKIENIFIHLFGDSSSGKSTFLKLAVSMWGSPDSPPLVSEWNSTVNAIYATLSGNLGIALGIDEASCTNSDFSTLIYNISHGRDKAKCNKDSSLREERTWNTTIISTAEESLLDKTKRNSGIKARCIEFCDLIITSDSNHADSINDFILQNFGVMGIRFVELLYKKSHEIVINDYNLCRKYLNGKIKNKINISDRLIKSYAVLLQTTLYIRRMGIAVEPIKIVDILIQQHQQLIENNNSVDEIINILTDYVIANKNKFPTVKKGIPMENISCEGVIENDKLYIIDTVFNKIVFSNRFSDFTLVKKWLNKKGYLEKHNGKYYKYKIISGIKTKCYEISIPMLKMTDLPITKEKLEKHKAN